MSTFVVMRRSGVVTMLVIAAFAAGCGGGSSSRSSATTTTAAATSSTAPPTTAAAKASTKQDSAAAKAATISTADLPGYKQYAKAQGWRPVTSESCGVLHGPLTTADHVYNGPQLGDPTKQVFVYTQAYVFENATTAQQYAKARTTDDYLKCKVDQDQQAGRTRNPRAFVSLSDTSYNEGNVLSLYREIAGIEDANRKRTNQVQYDRYTYVKGPVVVVINMDVGIPTTAAAGARQKVVNAAFDKVVTTLDTRVP